MMSARLADLRCLWVMRLAKFSLAAYFPEDLYQQVLGARHLSALKNALIGRLARSVLANYPDLPVFSTPN
jgi:hypothetical protein